MKDRIEKNEEKLDSILNIIKELDNSLDNFDKCLKDIKDVNKYYGSKSWFKDKELFENRKITNVNAGVLGEDTVWNMNEDIDDIIIKMQKLIKKYNKGDNHE
ncbi:MAG: DUF4298 domain-containing protein [Bacilli bacterium]|nr:DUF4298 domain-containing protein [Bacilli bacterium]